MTIYPPKPQFCFRKHDTLVVGRHPSGGCKQCSRERELKKLHSNDAYRIKANKRISQRHKERYKTDPVYAAKWRERERARILRKRAKDPLYNQKLLDKRLSQSWRRKGFVTSQGTIFTIQDRDQLLRAQAGTCAICTKVQHTESKKLAVDHNHQTGVVRGLLCDSCNLGLGLFQDSSSLLERAVAYLRRV